MSRHYLIFGPSGFLEVALGSSALLGHLDIFL
jgi:hypothetical protein